MGVTGAVLVIQLLFPSVRCRVNDNARGVVPPCVPNVAVKWVGVWTVVSIKVLGVFPPLPFGEGGNTNKVCDARGVAPTALGGAGGVSVDGKGTRIAGGWNDFRREDRGTLDDVEVEVSTERTDEDEDVTEPAEENTDEWWESEGEGTSCNWTSE